MANPATAPPLRVALLGAGIFASSAHKNQLLKLVDNSRVHVELVWSRSNSAAQKLAHQYGSHVVVAYHDPSQHPTPLQSARAVLRKYRSSLDAVILVLPIPQLASFAALVLTERLHLLQEKPLAADVASAYHLLSVSTPPNLVHAVAENYRFEPVFREACSMIPATCRKVIALHLTAHAPMPVGSRYGNGWRLALPGVGILADGLVHHIAAMRVILASDVASVMATCFRRGTTFAGCDTVSGTLTFANGVPANLFVIYVCNTFMWELRIIGTDGDVAVQRSTGKPGYTVSSVKRLSYGMATEEMDIPFSGLDSEFEAFVDSCIIEKVHPDLDAHEAFNDLATVEAMFESSNKGCRVSVKQPPTRLSPPDNTMNT